MICWINLIKHVTGVMDVTVVMVVTVITDVIDEMNVIEGTDFQNLLSRSRLMVQAVHPVLHLMILYQ